MGNEQSSGEQPSSWSLDDIPDKYEDFNLKIMFPGDSDIKPLNPQSKGPTRIFKITSNGQEWILKTFHEDVLKRKKKGVILQQELHQKLPEKVPKIYEFNKKTFFRAGDDLCFIEQYFGEDLFVYINKHIKNNDIMNDVLSKTNDLANALYENKIVHNDFRAVNILVRAEKPLTLAVTDFEDARDVSGVAKVSNCEQLLLARDYQRKGNKCQLDKICKNMDTTDMLTFIKEILYDTKHCFDNFSEYEWQTSFIEKYKFYKKKQRQQLPLPPKPKKRNRDENTDIPNTAKKTFRDLKDEIRETGSQTMRKKFNEVVSEKNPSSTDLVSPRTAEKFSF